MFGYSKVKHTVFIFCKNPHQKIEPRIEVETELLQLDKVTAKQWKDLKKLQGYLSVRYLKWRYGSSDTHILLAYVRGELAHVEWVIPAKKIQVRYPFVTENSHLIISCLTLSDFRGQRIYPSQLQNVVQSDVRTKEYWGLAACDNIPSLKGICGAGGVEAGVFIQQRWLWGIFSKAKYYPHEDGEPKR